MGLTQQGLASKLKVSRNTVARWERDEMAIPGFLHLALKTLECEAAKAATTPASINWFNTSSQAFRLT